MSDDGESASSSDASSSSSCSDASSSSSSPSEASDAPPTRQRSTALQRRDRQQQRRHAANAAPPPPASSSRWRAREKQFEQFRAGILVLPVPAGVARVDRAKGYSLHVLSVLNWVLPSAVLGSWRLDGDDNNSGSDSDDALLVTLGVHVSLFHAASKRFFGNTWASPELAVDAAQIRQRRHSADQTLQHVVESVALNARAYFVSDVVDASCVGVVELVAYAKDPTSKATVAAVGCGWTLLPLFAQAQQPTGAGDASGEPANVFVGSPRALWELAPAQWHAQPKQDRSQLYYRLALYAPLLAAAACVRRNELVGALEPVAGLRHANLANLDVGRNPKALLREDADTPFADALATFAKLAALVPRSIQLAESFALRVHAVRVALHLREAVEADLVARLRISRRALHAGAARIDGEVSARVLKLALHNGRCFRSRHHTVALKAEQPGSDHLRCVGPDTRLPGFVLHPHVALVVLLQFTVHFRLAWPPKLRQQALDAKRAPPPEEDVVLVTMGARALVPSDGHKLYLYDKHHHATATATAPLVLAGASADAPADDAPRRVLHVELLSGAPCRPYSDNPLYTPLAAGHGRLLEKHGLALTDSIAFVDLQLAVDGAETKAQSPTRAPAPPPQPSSPAKSLRKTKSNNDDEDSGSSDGAGQRVHAAELWAAKMLSRADKNAVLAQTLNALATAPPPPTPQDNQTHPSPPRSPAKQQRESGEAELVPLPLAKTSALSRASRTLLARHGFLDAHDTSATSHEVASSPPGARARPALPPPSSKSLDAELSDVYKAHEVRVHFAAFRSLGAAALVPARVYFTFQFYSFAPTRTETLRLSKGLANAGGESRTFLLMRESPATKPSRAIQFDVDTTAARDPLEPRRFAEYLLHRSLYVDVWDADSLFQLGTFAVPLHELLRQGSGIKKFQAEADVVQPIDTRRIGGGADDDDDDDVGGADPSAGGEVVGRVQFLLSNYGLKGRHALPSAASAPAPPPERGAPPARVKHRVRARPLVESNPELFRLLSQEGFYGASGSNARRRDRSANADARVREHRRQQARGWSDATSLSPAEIAVLCDRFGHQRGGDSAGPRSARIRCDRDSSSGLLALLAVHPPAPKQEAAAASGANAPAPEPTKPAPSAPRATAPSAPRATAPSVAQQRQLPSNQHVERLTHVLAIIQSNHVGLEAAFALFDADKDGVLSRDEFVQALRSMGTVFADLSDDDLAAVAGAMDADSDGRIAYKEFGAFLAAAQAPAPAPGRPQKTAAQWLDEVKRILVRATEKGVAVHQIFAQLDASGDGSLSYDEFGRALQRLGVPAADERRHRAALVRAFDQNQDQRVSYAEFLQALGLSVEASRAAVERDVGVVVGETLKRVAADGVEITHVFAHFDADKSGKLSVAELTQALAQLLQPSSSSSSSTGGANPVAALEREAIDAFVATFNANGDAEIDYREFLTLCGVPQAAQQAAQQVHERAGRVQSEKQLIKLLVRALRGGVRVETIFEQFDADADGKVTLAEFQRAMEQLFRGTALSADDAAAVVAARLDADGDRAVSLHEFQSFAREVQRQQRALAAVFAPHAAALAEAATHAQTLALGKWQQLCSKELKLSREQTEAAKPLLAYFELVDAAKKVDLVELCALLKEPPAASEAAGAPPETMTTEAPPADALLTRFSALLKDASKHGVDAAKCFEHFDTDGGGRITRREFADGMQQLGLGADAAVLGEVFARLDHDGSGAISMAEFKQLFSAAKEGAPPPSSLTAPAAAPAAEEGRRSEEAAPKQGGKQPLHRAPSSFAAARATTARRGSVSSQLGTESSRPAETSSPAPTAAPATSESSDRQAPSEAPPTTSASGRQTPAPPTTTERLRSLLQLAAQSGVDASASFSHFDSDGDGKITTAEFVDGVKALPGFEAVAPDELRELVGELDRDGGGSVSLDELTAFVKGERADGTRSESSAPLVTAASDAESSQQRRESVEATAEPDEQRADPSGEATSVEPSGAVASEKNVIDDSSVGDASAPPTTEAPEEEAAAAAAAEPAAPTAKPKGTRLATRAVSFAAAKGKPPSLAAARRAKTDSDSVAGAVDAPSDAPDAAAVASEPGDAASTLPSKRPPSFTAARAAKAAAARRGSVSSSGVADSSASPPPADAAPAISDATKDAQALDASATHRPASQVDSEEPKIVSEAAAAPAPEPTTTESVLTTAKTATKRVPATARAVSALAQAPVRRTSSLKPPAKAAAAAPTDGKTQAPVTRTSSLRPAARAPAVQRETPDSVVVAAPRLPAAKTTESQATTPPTDPNNTVAAAPTASDAAPSAPAPDGLANCAYAFHPDPQVRAVELKLRRAAEAAFARGVIPLRVVAKFLDQDADGAARSRKKRDELLRVEFLQVLMELGFSLLSDAPDDSNDDAGGEGDGRPRPGTAPRMNDYVYARQLERLARYKHHVQEESAAQRQLVRAVTKTKQQQQRARVGKQQQQQAAALRRFADDKQQLLRVLSYYRDGQKKALVYSLLREQVTTAIALAPHFAALLFLELPFANPYTHHERFRVELVRPAADAAPVLDIDVVRSDAEWAFYRRHLPLAYGGAGADSAEPPPVETEMIDDQNEVVMDGHDRIQIPVRLRWLGAAPAPSRSASRGADDEPAAVPVSVVVRSCTHGHTVALFKLQLRPQPPICHRVLRFSHPGGSIWRWRLRCPRGKFLVCLDPSVAVDGAAAGAAGAGAGAGADAVVTLKCRVGEYPSLEEFYVVLYDDAFFARVFEVWQVRVQAKLRLDVHAVLGQRASSELVIRGDARRRRVRCFAAFEHAHELQFRPAHVFQLVPSAFNRIELAFCTTTTAAATRRVLVNLVDVDAQELVGAWVVHVVLARPLVTKTYALELPRGHAAQKKIAYANPWDQEQTIALRSSAPAVLAPRDAVLHVPGGGTAFLRLAFAAVDAERAAREDVYLFINDRQTDQNEECLLFQVTYG